MTTLDQTVVMTASSGKENNPAWDNFGSQLQSRVTRRICKQCLSLPSPTPIIKV